MKIDIKVKTHEGHEIVLYTYRRPKAVTNRLKKMKSLDNIEIEAEFEREENAPVAISIQASAKAWLKNNIDESIINALEKRRGRKWRNKQS